MSKSIYRVCKDVWHSMPLSVRDQLRQNPLGRWMVGTVVNQTIKGARHQEIYDELYYQRVDECAVAAAPVMVGSMIKKFRPKTLIDVGCGTGALLAEFTRNGVSCTGFEYSERGLAKCRANGLNVHAFDLEQDAPLPEKGPFDVATSFEVAEHLPASLADRFVELLCSLSSQVVLTAATPGQGGLDHVNEQPLEYWIEKFRKRGAKLDEETTAAFRSDWKSINIAKWYSDNVMVFQVPPKRS